jgi:preprotein translocase subunit SecE
MVTKKKRKPKKRRPKGKPLSEALREREVRQSESDAAAPDAGDEDALQSAPPPSFEESESEEPDALDHPEPFEDEDDEERPPVPAPARAQARDEDEDEEEKEDEEAPRSYASDEDGEDDEDGEEYDDDEDDDDDEAATQMGHRRYVMAGFFGLWLVLAYIFGQALETAWSELASKDWFVEKLPALAAVPYEGDLISRSSVSLVVGAIIAGLGVGRYYIKPEIRTWADEVAEELTKVKWPTRKEVGNNTVVCIAAAAVITLYLSLLDRFWGFVTNLIYASGV